MKLVCCVRKAQNCWPRAEPRHLNQFLFCHKVQILIHSLTHSLQTRITFSPHVIFRFLFTVMPAFPHPHIQSRTGSCPFDPCISAAYLLSPLIYETDVIAQPHVPGGSLCSGAQPCAKRSRFLPWRLPSREEGGGATERMGVPAWGVLESLLETKVT